MGGAAPGKIEAKADVFIQNLKPGAIAKLIEEAGASGSDRVFGPVGLDLAAEGAEQIALSIVAELMAVRAARTPRHLREKENAIHAR